MTGFVMAASTGQVNNINLIMYIFTFFNIKAVFYGCVKFYLNLQQRLTGIILGRYILFHWDNATILSKISYFILGKKFFA